MQLKMFLAVAAVLSVATPLQGQTITGAITATVADLSGAVVPNVRVTATNSATNIAQTTHSNEAGVYNFTFLPEEGQPAVLENRI
jgi:hypothetical protein